MTACYAIVDLDNCISDDGWRVPKINWARRDQFGRYDAYHQLAAFDEFKNGAVIEQLVRDAIQIIIFTGRPARYFDMTSEWLFRKGIHSSVCTMVMRNEDDARRSVEVKAMQLAWLYSHYEIGLHEVVKAYDDRPEIVEMYRRSGIDAEVLSIHNVDAYIEPATGKCNA